MSKVHQVNINLDWNYEVFVTKGVTGVANGVATLPLNFTSKKMAQACKKFVEKLPNVASVDLTELEIKANSPEITVFKEFKARGIQARIAGITNESPFIKSDWTAIQGSAS